MPHTEYLPSTRLRLLAVDHDVPAPPIGVLTRIRVLAPWADTTAGLVIHTLRSHAHAGATIVVDLHDCMCADTTQLAVIIAGLRYARGSGATMVVSGSSRLRDLAAICRIDWVITWLPDRPAPLSD